MIDPTRTWRSLFAETVPKESDFPESNEDKLRICNDRHLYIMSDGASESFNSSLWADVLVESVFAGPPCSGFARWLKQVTAEYRDRSGVTSMSWSQEAAFARGSFASLLVVECLADEVSVTAIGDTVALLVENGIITRSFPYKDSYQFQQRPHLLSTVRSKNITPYFAVALRSLLAKKSCLAEAGCKVYWPYPSSTDALLICVTDAMGEWLLRQDVGTQGRLDAVLAVRTQGDLIQLIDDARREDGMRRDDSSLIVIGEGHVAPYT